MPGDQSLGTPMGAQLGAPPAGLPAIPPQQLAALQQALSSGSPQASLPNLGALNPTPGADAFQRQGGGIPSGGLPSGAPAMPSPAELAAIQPLLAQLPPGMREAVVKQASQKAAEQLGVDPSALNPAAMQALMGPSPGENPNTAPPAGGPPSSGPALNTGNSGAGAAMNPMLASLAGAPPQGGASQPPVGFPGLSPQPAAASQPAAQGPAASPGRAGALPLGGQTGRTSNGLYDPNLESPLADMAPSLPAIVAGMGLSWAGIKGLEALPKSANGLVQNSPLANLARTVDQAQGNWFDVNVARRLRDWNPGWGQVFYTDAPDAAMNRRLKAEWLALTEHFAHHSDDYGTRVVEEWLQKSGRELDQLMKRPLNELPQWMQQRVIQNYLGEQVTQLQPDSFKQFIKAFKPQANALGLDVSQLPSLSSELDQVLTDPAKSQALASELKELLTQPQGQQALEKVSQDVYRDMKSARPKALGTWFNEALDPKQTFGLNTAKAKSQLLQSIQSDLTEQLSQPIRAMDLVEDVRGGGHKALSRWFQGRTYQGAQGAEQVQAAVTQLQNILPDKELLRGTPKQVELYRKLHHNANVITDKASLEGVLDLVEEIYGPQAKQHSAITKRMRGFFGRTEALLSNVFEPYYEDIRLMERMGNRERFRRALLEQALKTSDLSPEVTRRYERALSRHNGQLGEVASDLLTHFSRETDAHKAARAFATRLQGIEQQVAKVKPLKFWGRLTVAWNQLTRRILTTESASASIRTGSGWAADASKSLLKNKWGMLFFSSMALFGQAIHESRKGDDPFDKARIFIRNLFGLGLLSFAGYEASRMLDGSFALAPKFFKGAASKLSRLIPFKGTVGGFSVELIGGVLVLGTLFTQLGHVITDRLLGRPNYLRREDAKNRQERLQRQQQSGQQEALLQQLLNTPQANPQALAQLQQLQAGPSRSGPGMMPLIGQYPAAAGLPMQQPRPLFSLSPEAIMNSRPAQMNASLSQGLGGMPGMA